MIKAIVIFLLTYAFAANADMSFHNHVGLGEGDLALYSGPLDPLMVHEPTKGNLSFVDDILNANYFAPITSNEIYEWEKIWFEEMPGQSVCPNSYMAQNIHYIRYLYRLLTLSYLYESLKDYQDTLYGIGGSSQACSLSYDILFKRCRPSGEDMKKFIGRAKAVINKDLSERTLKRFESKEQNNWIARVRNTRDDLSPAQSRVRSWCEQGHASCDSITEKEIAKALTEACVSEKELFVDICSEQDNLYGLSRLPEMVPVLASSHVLKIINTGGHGQACLERYARLLAMREHWHPPLTWIMPAVKNKLSYGDSRYPQGVLFVPGALREFDERGLGDFLFVEPTPEITPTPTPVVAVLPAPTPVPTPIVLPKVSAKPVVVVTPKPTPTPKPLSAFQYALQVHLNGRDPIDVDMKRFTGEGRFGPAVIEKLKEPLKQYQTRQALQDMRTHDKLGSIKEPLRLVFLKFLIDEDQHQGLWNIVNVIGEGFYVINDLEGRREPVWIKLRNDRSTNYAWQITIEVAPPETPKK